MKIIETYSEQETYQFACEYAKELTGGTVIVLDGDLGCGKTVIAKGIASGLDIDEPITSPTFGIFNIYEGGRLTLYHFDVYRIECEEEMEEIGYEEYFFSDGVCLVEWGMNVPDIIPDSSIFIKIEKDMTKGENYRRICVFAKEDNLTI